METATRPRPRARPLTRTRVTWTVLLVVAVLHAAIAVAQPLLAGAFLNGEADAMLVHGPLGDALAAVTMLLLAPAALLFLVPGKGSFWPLVVVVPLFFAEGMQIGMGHSRQLGIHVPLGVAIVGTSVALVWYLVAWRYRLGKRLKEGTSEGAEERAGGRGRDASATGADRLAAPAVGERAKRSRGEQR